jgi:hypothetical protein
MNDETDDTGADGRFLVALDNALSSRVARVASAIVAALALTLAVVVGVQQVRLTNCLSRYNDASAKATAARSSAAAQDRKADDADRAATDNERKAIVGLFDALSSGDQAQVRGAITNAAAAYQAGDLSRAQTAKTRADNEQKRRDNPVPQPPSLTCGS